MRAGDYKTRRRMAGLALILAAFSLAVGVAPRAGRAAPAGGLAYLGFDRNLYPGDAALRALRRTFHFAGYWLSPPPGATTNTWAGKREVLHSHGFGFVVLFRGRETREMATDKDAVQLADTDAHAAALAARQDGFAGGTVIFLDVEEGGRLPSAYHTYLREWVDQLTHLNYLAGVYCSGMPVMEPGGVVVVAAEDIRHNLQRKDVVFWVYNDACPPSPGCVFSKRPPSPRTSGVSFASIWQFAQSPRRREFTLKCPPGYDADGNCHAPGDKARAWDLDVNAASSPDPSSGRR